MSAYPASPVESQPQTDSKQALSFLAEKGMFSTMLGGGDWNTLVQVVLKQTTSVAPNKNIFLEVHDRAEMRGVSSNEAAFPVVPGAGQNTSTDHNSDETQVQCWKDIKLFFLCHFFFVHKANGWKNRTDVCPAMETHCVDEKN